MEEWFSLLQDDITITTTYNGRVTQPVTGRYYNNHHPQWKSDSACYRTILQ